MEALGFLFNAFAGGFLVFVSEELLQALLYSWPTIIAAVVAGTVVLRFALRRTTATAAWVMTGALVAGLTAVVRLGIAYGGYVSFLQGVHAFAIRDLHDHTYLLFLLSGGLAGGLLAQQEPAGSLRRVLGILGIALGVLYHLKVAEGWMSMRPIVRPLLFAGEFIAPALFAYAMGLLGRRRL